MCLKRAGHALTLGQQAAHRSVLERSQGAWGAYDRRPRTRARPATPCSSPRIAASRLLLPVVHNISWALLLSLPMCNTAAFTSWPCRSPRMAVRPCNILWSESQNILACTPPNFRPATEVSAPTNKVPVSVQ